MADLRAAIEDEVHRAWCGDTTDCSSHCMGQIERKTIEAVMRVVGTLVDEGWWHPNVKDGQVHDHKPNQPATMHRLCEPVYTRRQST